VWGAGWEGSGCQNSAPPFTPEASPFTSFVLTRRAVRVVHSGLITCPLMMGAGWEGSGCQNRRSSLRCGARLSGATLRVPSPPPSLVPARVTLQSRVALQGCPEPRRRYRLKPTMGSAIYIYIYIFIYIYIYIYTPRVPSRPPCPCSSLRTAQPVGSQGGAISCTRGTPVIYPWRRGGLVSPASLLS